MRSLLEAVGTVIEEHNGKLKVTLGSETEVVQPPHGKDIDPQLIVDLRRMLTKPPQKTSCVRCRTLYDCDCHIQAHTEAFVFRTRFGGFSFF